MFLFCLVFAVSLCVSVCVCFVVTCWERADLLALVCGVWLWVCHFPIGILGQVWYLIVSIPDAPLLTFKASKKSNNEHIWAQFRTKRNSVTASIIIVNISF